MSEQGPADTATPLRRLLPLAAAKRPWSTRTARPYSQPSHVAAACSECRKQKTKVVEFIPVIFRALRGEN